jgi:ATP-dependent Zn protease
MTQSLGDMLISWAPMLLLIGVWVFFAQRAQRAQQKQQNYMAVVQTYVTEHIAETKRISQNLERIASALERRQG